MDNSPANFQCDTCQKTFARLFGNINYLNYLNYFFPDLNDHATIHADERPFECEICDQKFKTKSSLRDHETVHEELTPYECSICRTPIRWVFFILFLVLKNLKIKSFPIIWPQNQQNPMKNLKVTDFRNFSKIHSYCISLNLNQIPGKLIFLKSASFQLSEKHNHE